MATHPHTYTPPPAIDEHVARLFHDTYERLAPTYGYATRPESATTWDQVPEPNRMLMIATAREVLSTLTIHDLHALLDTHLKQHSD